MEVNIGANSVQLMLEAKGITGPDGKISANLQLTDGRKVHIQLPSEIAPFLKPGAALVVVTVIQVNPKDEPIIPASNLILPR